MKNIILITIDSLRADHLSCLGYHRETTPNLDKLAKEGVLFSQAISCGPITLASFIPLFTSTYFLTYYTMVGRGNKIKTNEEALERVKEVVGDVFKQKIPIASIFKQKGYSTAAFHSNPLLSKYYNFDIGFDYFYDSLSGKTKRYSKILGKIEGLRRSNKKIHNIVRYAAAKYLYASAEGDKRPLERAAAINERVISWLKDNKNDFFIWVHYMDVHSPYKPLKEFYSDICSKPISRWKKASLYYKMYSKPERIQADEIEELIDLYDGEIRYTDYAIKSLLDEMADIGVLDNTLIVITADHGEEFKEHGDFGHNHKLYDELIHVPLIISNSSYRNIAIKDTVSLLDITPTIIDLLNIPETETFQEKSLIPIIEGKRKSSGVISEILDIQGKRVTSYRTKEWKYILSEAGNRRELYNIRKDPQERENVYEEEEEKVKEFESMILKHISDQIKMVRGVIDEKERIKGKIRELKTLREM